MTENFKDIHPENYDKATLERYGKTLEILELLPQNPEFPFFLRDLRDLGEIDSKKKGVYKNVGVLLVAPNNKGEFALLSPTGFWKINKDNEKSFDVDKIKVKLSDVVQKILECENDKNHCLYSRPTHFPPYIILTTEMFNNYKQSFMFKVVGKVSDEDTKEAIANSMKMSKDLYDNKYNPALKRLRESQSVLDFAKNLLPK